MLWSLQYWSEGSQILVQFIFYSYNVSSECLGPKGCPRKKLECDFWGRGQNWKLQITKKNLKYIQNNAKWKYKAHATVTFSISALISEIWAFKAKKCGYFGSKGPNKKSVQRKKVSEYVFWYWQSLNQGKKPCRSLRYKQDKKSL